MSNHILEGAVISEISGGSFTIQSEKSAFDKLSEATAHSALHDAPARTDESRCHQYTRTHVLDKLERWAQGICDEGAPIFLLYGGAGAGKSAIMQTLAERCVDQKLALGSFFFSRTDTARNTAEVLIPTLAYQLAQSFPSALHFLNPIINRDPLIFKKSLQVQLLSLLIRPLQHLVKNGIISNAPQSPRVFLIDGLDECDDSTQQQSIIQAVARVCHEHYIPVKFLIASRSELAISTSFRRYKQENHVLGAISLNEDPNSEADIQRFIKDEFLKIRSRHPFNHMIPCEWPDLYDINRLVWKSSSHFIYASTAMKYIWSAKESPVRSLQVVLGLEVSRTTFSPFPELDAFYHHIFGSAAHRDKVLQILANCLYVSSSVAMACIMLDCSKDDLFIYMADMAPLVVLSKPALAHEEQVTLLHASLGDFLRDQFRSGSLYVDEVVYLASKLERCFQLLNLYSRQQRTEPDWPASSNDSYLSGILYNHLLTQITTTVQASGHFSSTQEILRRYRLGDFYECQLRLQNHAEQEIHDVFDHLIEFFIAVHAIKTSDGAMLFRSNLEDFFDILESHIGLESMPLGPAILPLLFSGYPAQTVRKIHFRHSRDYPSYSLIAKQTLTDSGFVTTLDVITMADLTSIRHRVNTSPKFLAMAAEAILGYLFDEPQMQPSSTCSPHKTWLQRAKPGKHTATGAPWLASAIYAQWNRLFRLMENSTCSQAPCDEILIHNLRSLFPMLSLKHCFWDNVNVRMLLTEEQKIVAVLLDALLWLVPKASFSEKIMLYSKRTFPRNIYQRQTSLVHRVRRCLDTYSTRIGNAKLQELGRRMDNGDVTALIEKSCMFYLDAQD